MSSHYFTHTETETEDNDVAAAIAKQKAQLSSVKKKGSDAGRSSFYKRIIVAWFLLSQYLLPLHMGYQFHHVNMIFINFCIFDEFSHLVRDSKKQRAVSVALEWFIFMTFLFQYSARYTLTKTSLTESGYTKSEYPLLHNVLFDWQTKIVLFMATICVIWFCAGL